MNSSVTSAGRGAFAPPVGRIVSLNHRPSARTIDLPWSGNLLALIAFYRSVSGGLKREKLVRLFPRGAGGNAGTMQLTVQGFPWLVGKSPFSYELGRVAQNQGPSS